MATGDADGTTVDVDGTTTTVDADGTTLRYVDDAGDAPAVVFLSGVGFGPWLWSWQAPALASRYRTVVPATRGTGGSTAAPPYSVDRFAADLEAVLADAGVDRAHLVGAGLGGAVALRYVGSHGRARSLALFGTPPSGDRVDRDALGALHPEDPSRLRESLSLAFTGQFRRESGLVDDVVDWRRREDATGEALAGHRSALLEYRPKPLYEVDVPALVCHGVDDPVVPRSAGEELAADLPRGRFEAVEGKRLAFVEHSAAVTDALERFLDGVSRS